MDNSILGDGPFSIFITIYPFSQVTK